MTEGPIIVEANSADFWSVVKHPLDLKNPATRDTVRKIAFGIMKKCSMQEALKIQNFLDSHGVS